MISVFDYEAGSTSFDGNGTIILSPISGSVHQVAAGNYDLTMVHPIDPDGKWKYLIPENIIKAPVPEETIETAYTGYEADVYKTTSAAALRTGPNEPESITYSSWSAGTSYSVGAKVTSGGHNYQLMTALTGNEIYTNPSASSKWRRIADSTSGDPVLVDLKKNTKLYLVESYNSSWYIMMTMYGMQGYIKKSQVEFYQHLTPSETKPRVIKDQLFRIKKVVVDTKSNQVTVNAEHVSYDLNGVLIKDGTINTTYPAYAISKIQDAFMIEYLGEIATDLTSQTDEQYDVDLSGKSGMYALLDPDNGVVSKFGAMFRRDNWDLFVLAKTETDRGFRLRYGNNMLGVNWSKDSSNLITRIVPVAKKDDGTNLYLSGDGWVDSDDIEDYPVIRMERLKVNGQVGKDDGTETGTNWTTTTLRAEMKAQAERRFDVDHCDRVIHDITVDFEMLGHTAEHPDLKNLQQVLLYDNVIVTDERIDLSVSVMVSELEFDIIKEKITSLKLTNVNEYNLRNVSGFNVVNNSITGDKLTDGAGDEIVSIARDLAYEYADDINTSVRSWVSSNFVHN